MLRSVGVVSGRGEHHIQGQSQTVLNHHWDYPLQKGAGELETGVGVDLNQPGLEVIVYHKVQTKYLKVTFFVFWREF